VTQLVLSLFPGIGLLDMAFEEEGFCVVRGPDLLWGGDVRRFHPPAGRFEGVIGGPPCQPFSPLIHLIRHQGKTTRHPNLVPEFERVVTESAPEWFVMEESPYAPLPSVPGYLLHAQVLNNRWLGEKQNRVRRVSFGTLRGQPLILSGFTALEHHQWEHAVTADTRAVPVAIGGSGRPKGLDSGTGRRASVKDMLELQGFPRELLAECPLTVGGQKQAIGNGVPLPMGRAIARAVKAALGIDQVVTA
jgi:DNA (cytosine-5)-methyltransferase 1